MKPRNAVLTGVFALALAVLPSTAGAAAVPLGEYGFMREGSNASIDAMARLGGSTYVGGQFSAAYRPVPVAGVFSAAGTGEPAEPALPQVQGGEVLQSQADGDGGWWLGGTFTHVDGEARPGLVHVLADGTVDRAFAPEIVPDFSVGSATVVGVRTFLFHAGVVYAFGTFKDPRTLAVQTNVIAAFDAESGELMPGKILRTQGTAVEGFAVHDGQLYVYGGSMQRIYADDSLAGTFATEIANQRGVIVLHLDRTRDADHPLNQGLLNITIRDVVFSGDVMYFAGHFFNLTLDGKVRNHIGAFDLTTGELTDWDPAPGGSFNNSRTMYGLEMRGSTLYLAGSFTADQNTIGGVAATGLVALDAETGQADPDWVAPIETGTRVYDIEIAGDALYAAGPISSLGGPGSPQARSGAAAFDLEDGAALDWNPAFGHESQTVATSGGQVLIGGLVNRINPEVHAATGPIARIADDGSLDTEWGANVGSRVFILAAAGDSLWAAGPFATVAGEPRNGLAELDPATGALRPWNPNFENDADQAVQPTSIAANSTHLYVAGPFTSVDGVPRAGIAEFRVADGSLTDWNPAPPEPGAVSARVAVSEGRLVWLYSDGLSRYRAASYLLGGGTPALAPVQPNVVFTGSQPHAYSRAFEIVGDRLFSAVEAVPLGGGLSRGAPMVDLTTGAIDRRWDPYPEGSWIRDVATGWDRIYLAGGFDAVDEQPRGRFAAVASVTGRVLPFTVDVNGDVNAIAVDGNRIFVGGSFQVLDGELADGFGIVVDDEAQPEIPGPGPGDDGDDGGEGGRDDGDVDDGDGRTPPPVGGDGTDATRPGTVKARRGPVIVGARRRATVAALKCSAAATCRIAVPRRAKAVIGGRPFAVRVVAPRHLAAGQRGLIRIILPAKATKRLKAMRHGRTAFPVRIKAAETGAGSPTVTSRIRVKLKTNGARPTNGAKTNGAARAKRKGR